MRLEYNNIFEAIVDDKEEAYYLEYLANERSNYRDGKPIHCHFHDLLTTIFRDSIKHIICFESLKQRDIYVMVYVDHDRKNQYVTCQPDNTYSLNVSISRETVTNCQLVTKIKEF